MSLDGGGNPQPNRPDNSGEWDLRECPICGETVKKIATHIKYNHD